MNAVERYYPLIDPINGENDRDMGPGLTKGDLTVFSINHLALGIINERIQRTFHLEIGIRNLKLVFKISFTVLWALAVLWTCSAYRIIKLCDPPDFGICFEGSLPVDTIIFTVFLVIWMTYGFGEIYYAMILDVYIPNRVMHAPVTIREIRNLGPLLSRDELNRMDLIQFSEALRVTHRNDFSDLSDDKYGFFNRINDLRRLSAETFTSLFNSPQARDFIRRYPGTCVAYRVHLPERLRHLERLLDRSALHAVDRELLLSRVSSSSPTQISVITRIESTPPSQFRNLLDDIEACRSYISQTGFATAEEQTITAHILHIRPILINLLSRPLALNVITYFVEKDLIHNVKTLHEHRPDVKRKKIRSLVIKAAQLDRTNILKYLLTITPTNKFAGIAEDLIEIAHSRNNLEILNHLFERYISLPVAYYECFSVYNVFSNPKIAKQFHAFIEKIFNSLSSNDFNSIKQVICLIRYLMHLINRHRFQNEEISPPLTVVAVLTTLSKYIHNTSLTESSRKIKNNLNFALDHLRIIWEFLQTRKDQCKIPDNNFPAFFESIEADIHAKLNSLEGHNHASSYPHSS